MIIPNGTIRGKIKIGGGINENGDPIKPSFGWSSPVECRYTLNTCNYKAVSDGNTYKDVTYEILIDDQSFPFEQVMLESESGVNLGEFSLRGIESEDMVCALKLFV